MNLFSISKLNSLEMNEVIGSGVPADGVACNASNCKKDIHTSVNNTLENMRVNNPPRPKEDEL